MFNNIHSGTRRFLVIGLIVSFLSGAGIASVVVGQDQDNPTFPRLSVGAFGKQGREQGLAGGIRFSGATFSVNALRGEAPIVVKDETGRSGLTVRPNGDVYIDRDLVVYGQKKFVQPHPKDPQRLISYVALEGPEAGTYSRGTAQLNNGQAVIELPEHFALTTSEKGLTAVLTPIGEWLELYVVQKSTARIVVKEARGKTGRFDYFIQGIRKGHEDYQAVTKRQ